MPQSFLSAGNFVPLSCRKKWRRCNFSTKKIKTITNTPNDRLCIPEVLFTSLDKYLTCYTKKIKKWHKVIQIYGIYFVVYICSYYFISSRSQNRIVTCNEWPRNQCAVAVIFYNLIGKCGFQTAMTNNKQHWRIQLPFFGGGEVTQPKSWPQKAKNWKR